ncbi:MAG: hypothetical protein ACFE0J_07145 [Elainellaceae cyanobacterium]
MINLDPDALREAYEKQRPLYKEFASYVCDVLDREIRQRNIRVLSVKHRAKEVESFVRKALRQQYFSPINEITDKAGVRVTTVYLNSLKHISNLVSEKFLVHKHEDKRLSLNPHELGYLGIHFEVSLKTDEFQCDVAHEKYKDLICEIQLHTQAQNLWAGVSHELLYKPVDQELSIQTKRDIFRLIALVEIFDNEIENAREEMSKAMSDESYPQEIKILRKLEEYFRRFTDKPFDKELSAKIINRLMMTFESQKTSEIDSTLDEFIESKKDKIKEIFDDYSDDERRNPLLFQPESLLIFERLEHNSFLLKEIWNQFFPLRLLESFGAIWGVRV